MIIRSQDKKTIANFNKIDTICAKVINPTKAIKEQYETLIQYYSGVEETMGVLGEYSTEEKAIKVLDMIQDFYCKCESGKVVTSGIWGLLIKRGTLEDAEEFRDEHRTLFVFQMPQDSEV